MSDASNDLALALELASRAGDIAMRYFGRALERERKTDGTWVTEADRAVETEIRRELATAHPDHNVLGEEEGLRSASGGPPVEGVPTWIVDPIDGTNNFIAGIPIWATLIALQVDGQNAVGVANAPAIGETYSGAIGLGAHMNGSAIRVAPVEDLSAATAVFSGLEDFAAHGLKNFLDGLVERCWRSRGFGDFWGHMLVARGAVHLMVEAELSVWDVAALEPIVSEAGGRLSHLDGNRWQETGSCLTSCGSLHDQVLDLVRELAPEWKD